MLYQVSFSVLFMIYYFIFNSFPFLIKTSIFKYFFAVNISTMLFSNCFHNWNRNRNKSYFYVKVLIICLSPLISYKLWSLVDLFIRYIYSLFNLLVVNISSFNLCSLDLVSILKILLLKIFFNLVVVSYKIIFHFFACYLKNHFISYFSILV